MSRTLVVAATGLLLAATSCSGLEGVTGPDPEPVAERLASGLQEGDLAEVVFVDAADPTEELAGIVEGLGEIEPSVSVQQVVEGESGEAATATLGWTWPVSEQEWSYTSEARLTLVEDAWRVEWDPAVVEPSLREGGVLEQTALRAERGDIIGAGGRPLVTERPVTRFGIDKTAVPARRAVVSARELAVLLDIDPAPYARRVKQAGDQAFVEALVLRRADIPVEVGARYQQIPGALAVRTDLPLAQTREFAAPILGTVGEPTAEMIEEDPDRYAPGQQVGLSGLQLRYDEQLVGTPGVVVARVASDGQEKELFRQDATPGRPLRLTLDAGLQQTAERLLADVGPASALVAIKPSSGAILAAANGPGTGGYNLATFGQAPPGSTFKAVSTLALLRAGAGPETVVPCTGAVVVDGKRFENYDDYPPGDLGRIPLRRALASSCNTAFIAERERLGRRDLVDAAASLGMGVDHDLGFPAYFGAVTPASGETEAAANLIGQGKVLASPMAMASVIASVQARRTVLPSLVRDHEVAQAEVPPLTRAEAAALQEMLRGVVTGGSGSLLADVPGPPVLAKTGTAEYVADGGALRTHAWMIGAQGDLAVAVFVETGPSGSSTAGPVLEAFLRSR
ncbi:penicillin-binding transpeptidase domain-containing protein [Nocardioides coralli]|uniref:penicillin-binding transpeptidase domain-containing protein n=1 Tax=Nocardioides coralli TaxID=2872154 RepID=UPI001CA3F088|nr:penicillin-binding transpeptidase domain-containing protein [Nocardioides coralli]QZY29057.1 penicillin-binding protein [Nocardioides coralli]